MVNPMSKVSALYLRVSSKAQKTESQEPDLKRWEANQDGPVAWYRDSFTGKTMDRPGFNRLIADINGGKIGTLVVWRLDRLGRTAKGLTSLFDDLQARKVNLVSIKDGLDLSTPAGRLMANVLASVAAYETEVRGERVLAGQAVARAKGKTWGGMEKGKRLKVTTEQETVIRRMKSEGGKVAAIARATGLSRPTVYSVLSD
jgi:DNA invertase Pin-like site-specific DNA recombinase